VSRARLTIAALALAVCAATGCSPTVVSLREGPREYVATDYEDVLDRWTRTEDMITLSQLDNLLEATATFESWDFRWAYVVRYSENYRLTLEQRKKLLDQTLDETKESHHFFVAITGGNRRFNDLTKPNSAWIVRLIDSTGNETAPEDIVAIKKPNAIEQTYYPYITIFHQAFRIKFPRFGPDGKPTISPDAEWFGLRVAGAQGNSELVWVVDRDTSAPKALEGGPKPSQPSDSTPPSEPGKTAPATGDKSHASIEARFGG
jgi:hypothetical protein